MNLAVMLIGFGGPEKPGEARAFLESVLRGVKIPQARFEEVLHHYDMVGGVSPYNSITYNQKEALEKELSGRGIKLPVFVGFRHSSPSLADTLREMKKQGIQKVIGFVLASLRSQASFEKYIERIEEAKKEVGAEEIEFVYTEPFHENPLFIEAQVAEVLNAGSRSGKTHFIFSAHSIPLPMAQASGYDKQFEKMSELIAQKIGISEWSVAYQSRSGNPRDPWLEPSVESVIQGLDPQKYKNVLLVSSGFLCDNVEVIYDLDIECRNLCQKQGLGYFRAKTVTAHPQFIRLVADLIKNKL